MIELTNLPAEAVVLELGGGDNPHPRTNINVDVRKTDRVHFQCDFSQDGDWPEIANESADVVLAFFVMEHIPFVRTRNFLHNACRIVKQGGKIVFALPNTEAQFKWIQANPGGWDGKGLFESSSEVLFGSQDYSANFHAIYLNPQIAMNLFTGAGFVNVRVQPYNPRDTDMVVTAERPKNGQLFATSQAFLAAADVEATTPITAGVGKWMGGPVVSQRDLTGYNAERLEEIEKAGGHDDVIEGKLVEVVPVAKVPSMSREEMFDKVYWNGGGKVGGYKSDQYGAYRDFFPTHDITARHVLARNPESVLELGASRGYVLKRIQDAGIRAAGLEISRHCFMTRVANEIRNCDLCATPWPIFILQDGSAFKGEKFDLCYSVAVLEHIPEEHLPAVIGEMVRTCKRGLHGVDFGGHDDGFDKTHCLLRDKVFWIAAFNKHAPGWPVEVVDKESLEQGPFPNDVLRADGLEKWNLGSFISMSHHNWVNLDIQPCHNFASENKFRFIQHDLKTGLPCNTASVDLIMMHHSLEHLTAGEGFKLLQDCRRVMKPDGVMRIVVPDARLLAKKYVVGESLGDYGEINDGVEKDPTDAGKFWALMFPGHAYCYDATSLSFALTEAGFTPHLTSFRQTKCGKRGEQILRETQEMDYGLSLFVEATPRMDV